MTDPMHQQLLGHLLGALDDDEHQRVDALLERDEECCRHWLQWWRRLAALETMRPEIEPPPGLAARTCRYVAARWPAMAESQTQRRKRGLSAQPVPPIAERSVGWLDVAAVTLLLVTAFAMILPAIDDSRFQAGRTSCQDGLRQFGAALGQYADRQHASLGDMACKGRLTPAGVSAAGCLGSDGCLDRRRPLCPHAWLAAQGVLCRFSAGQPRPEETTLTAAGFSSPPGPLSRGVFTVLYSKECVGRQTCCEGVAVAANDPCDDWSGPCRPIAAPLLADTPSDEAPGGQLVTGHRGRGRNVLYDDGRVDFLPATANRPASGWLPAYADLRSSGRPVPVVFVNGR